MPLGGITSGVRDAPRMLGAAALGGPIERLGDGVVRVRALAPRRHVSAAQLGAPTAAGGARGRLARYGRATVGRSPRQPWRVRGAPAPTRNASAMGCGIGA